MSVASGPSTVSSSLEFQYDMYNPRTYAGPAINNLAPSISVIGTGTGTGYSSSSLIRDEHIPNLGWTRTYTNIIQNTYTSYAPNSTNCCPSLHAWDGITVSPSTLYTYAIVYKCNSGYTNANYMYRYEFTSNGGTYITEGGVHSDANRVALGAGWYYAWGTFTTSPTTTWLGHCGTFYYRYSTTNDRLSIAKVLITPGNYAGLHPSKWPSQSTTRSNTSVMKLSGSTNTIAAASLSYAPDGTFSFNGSGDHMIIPDVNLGNGNVAWTISAWVRTTTTASTLGTGPVVSNWNSGPVYSAMCVNSGKIAYWTYQNATWTQKLGVGKTVNDNVWHYLTWVNYTNYTMDMYVDGVLDSNVANSTSGNNNPINSIGRSWAGYFVGSIASVRRYSKALTAIEVLQNFNALRGRFGV